MNKEDILKNYPELFGENPLNSLFEFKNGWQLIYEKLFNDISNIIKNQDLQTFRITAINENCGTLRVEVNEEHEDIQELIFNASEESSSICEVCGLPGELFLNNKTKLFKTVCENHCN